MKALSAADPHATGAGRVRLKATGVVGTVCRVFDGGMGLPVVAVRCRPKDGGVPCDWPLMVVAITGVERAGETIGR